MPSSGLKSLHRNVGAGHRTQRDHANALLSGETQIHSGTYIALAAFFLVVVVLAASTVSKRKEKNRAAKQKRARDPSAPSGPLPPDITEAARTGQISTMRRWCGSDADACDIDAKAAGVEGAAADSTALHLAAAFGHGEVVRLLLEAGADAALEDAERSLALHSAASNGHGMCVKMLLDAGGDPRHRNTSGKNALECAQGSGNVGCVLLIQRKINVNARAAQQAGGGAMQTPIRLRRPAEEMC